MNPHASSDSSPVAGERDRGSVLIFVLVLMVIGSLVVLPLLSYSTAVFKANNVLSQQTQRAEAAKSGLRVALADPLDLYQDCEAGGLNSPVELDLPELAIPTTTECMLIGVASARDDFSVPFAVGTTFAGSSPVSGSGVVGTVFTGSGNANETAWTALTSTDGTYGTVWLPELPVHSLAARSSTPYVMPSGYILGGYTTCKVYFPGTYKQPITINSPTYFTSGVYYFEDTVSLVGGADVVVGSGSVDGCIDDQYAAFYATDAPATHNISGLGATFVFGDAGRLVIDDAAGAVSLRMNQRYVQAGDTGNEPSQLVSIMTVNGDLDDALAITNLPGAGIDLHVPGQIMVPLSGVGGAEVDRDAPADEYRPSILTPAPREPNAPTGLSATARRNALIAAWTAPISNGGSPITSYTVTAKSGSVTAGSCTSTQLTCLVTGLTNGTAYTLTVTATSAIGTSRPSTAASGTPSSTAVAFTAPGAAGGISVVQSATLPSPKVSRYVDAFDVSWTAPSSTGNAPINRYLVEILDGTAVMTTCETDGATTCVASGLALTPADIDLKTFHVRVTTFNVAGSTAQSEGGFKLDPLGEVWVAPTAPVTAYTPDPVLAIELHTDNEVTVEIPGYIAVPQGVVEIDTTDADNKTVTLTGGVLSAWSTVSTLRPADGFKFGLLNPATQRFIRLLTKVDGTTITGEAVVQINETGAWAVNSWSIAH